MFFFLHSSASVPTKKEEEKKKEAAEEIASSFCNMAPKMRHAPLKKSEDADIRDVSSSKESLDDIGSAGLDASSDDSSMETGPSTSVAK